MFSDRFTGYFDRLSILDSNAAEIDKTVSDLTLDARRLQSVQDDASERDFDVVLSDISMPGMDGFEFLRQLRLLPGKKDLPVLALTGFGRPEDILRAQTEGFFFHLTKPLDAEILADLALILDLSILQRDLAGCEHQIAGAHPADIIGDRLGRCRDGDAELC